ncbi:putative ABC transporter ATP-binding protein YxlF [Hartmannibacter diazotrophicus]|uniref:Putative ABC transporter ATP-binding protein YxlF n=1 Tax=Hartmannibacter diazotrophicus TaxID=1482074 RepID=A0A2C9DDS7_9HYPH|nr:ABC transporter ATP-binding protein [Hartmannibacter diazotrophicus]SON58403.1 putative ABC transporter ATP-binding protein YxlF [Hartmannibacter diazotrophicus]
MSTPVIEAHGLTKSYGGVKAVDGLDLTVNAGEIFGLLGPNGAGKTTTILMLLGLTEPTAGTVRILGHDPLTEPLAVKRAVGYLPDAVGFYDTMTARENLRYTAKLAGIAPETREERIEGALKRVRLLDVADSRVKTFSRGMRQRLGLCDLLVKGCEVAILDEPTSGLDPQSTQELLDLIKSFASDGMTVLLSSHLLGMVQSICHRVALFNKGRVGLSGTVSDIAAKVLGGVYSIEVEAHGLDLRETLTGMDGIARVEPNGDTLVTIDAARDLRADIARKVVEAGGALERLTMSRSDLDDVYVRYFEEVDHAA